jgi:hypothetical protein
MGRIDRRRPGEPAGQVKRETGDQDMPAAWPIDSRVELIRQEGNHFQSGVWASMVLHGVLMGTVNALVVGGYPA